MDFSSFFNYPDAESEMAAEEFAFLPTWTAHYWEKLLSHMQTHVFRKGEVVIRAGETERALHIVSYGTLEVLLPIGKSLIPITSIMEGSVLGEQAFLDGKSRSATIRAATDSQTLYLGFTAFEVFSAKEPELAHRFLLDLGRIVSLRLRQTTALLSQWRK